MSLSEYREEIAAAISFNAVDALRKRFRAEPMMITEDKMLLEKDVQRREDSLAAHRLGKSPIVNFK